MCKKLVYLVCCVLIFSMTGSVAVGGLAFPDPDGGWTYIFNGDTAAPGADFTALDGTWSHDNGSDQWDESEIGSGNPGGVSALVEDDITFIRMQDNGDATDYGMPDPSNRKVFFGHSITDELGDTANALLDDGVALTFRARVPTTPPLDDLYPDGGSGSIPYPAGGDGYVGHDTGKDNFGFHQASDIGKISFALSLASDSAFLEGKSGLSMNSLDGAEPSGVVDIQDSDGILNILELDPTVWHEFWIVIETDTTGTGTHLVTIYVDGDITNPAEFYVTAGIDNTDYDDVTYLSMGVGATPQSGALDVDFVAYKEGAVHPPGAKVMAQKPRPANGSVVEDRTVTLSWTAGDYAVSHDVYLSESYTDVESGAAIMGNQAETSYGPIDLEYGKIYYWRIDEVNEANPDSPWRGVIWSFEAANYLVLEGFEDYNDYPPDEVWNTWFDGFGDPANGSTAGYPDPDFNIDEHYLEGSIVHSGNWSMPLFYNNAAGISEVTKTLTSMKDWTQDGVVTLSLFYYGDAANAAEPMYFAVNGSAVVTNDDTNAALVTEWARFDIPLQEIADQGVNLTNVGSMTIGFGNKNNPVVGGGSGHVFFDDIRLYRPELSKSIVVKNASFELPGTEKIKGWNGEGVGGTPAEDIPGWSSDSEVADSGVETGWGATDGEWTAFLMGGDPSVWQLTSYVIGADDVIEMKVDSKNNWQATTLQISLYIDDNGARIPVAVADAELTDEMQEFSVVLNAADVPDAVGALLGIEINNVTEASDSWLAIDNIRLTAQ